LTNFDEIFGIATATTRVTEFECYFACTRKGVHLYLFALCWHFANKYMDGWMDGWIRFWLRRFSNEFYSCGWRQLNKFCW